MKFKLNCTPFGLRCFRIISAVISGILIILEISSINKIQFFSKLKKMVEELFLMLILTTSKLKMESL